MEEILQAASELGLMIKDTDIYQSFAQMSAKVNEDDEARALLQEYSRTAEEIQTKEQSGIPIEVFEKNRFQELVDALKASDLLMQFFEHRDRYIEFLSTVQNALGD